MVTSPVDLTIKGPGGRTKHLKMMIGTQTLCSELVVRVEQLWGIPPELQMLSLGGHLLQPQTHLQSYHIENGTCIDLSVTVKGLGGGGESDSSTGKVLA